MSTATPYRVTVKLGAAEFSAEGPEDTVKEQLAHFFIAATQPIQFKANGNGEAHAVNHSNGNGATNGNGTPKPPPGESQTEAIASADGLEFRTSVPPALLQRLFKRSEEGIVTLRALPKSDNRNGDALMLILWGHFVLKNQGDVLARDLLAALRQSGITRLDRVDETLEKKAYADFVSSGGSRSHKWYGLTNRGITVSENLAKTIFD